MTWHGTTIAHRWPSHLSFYVTCSTFVLSPSFFLHIHPSHFTFLLPKHSIFPILFLPPWRRSLCRSRWDCHSRNVHVYRVVCKAFAPAVLVQEPPARRMQGYLPPGAYNCANNSWQCAGGVLNATVPMSVNIAVRPPAFECRPRVHFNRCGFDARSPLSCCRHVLSHRRRVHTQAGRPSFLDRLLRARLVCRGLGRPWSAATAP